MLFAQVIVQWWQVWSCSHYPIPRFTSLNALLLPKTLKGYIRVHTHWSAGWTPQRVACVMASCLLPLFHDNIYITKLLCFLILLAALHTFSFLPFFYSCSSFIVLAFLYPVGWLMVMMSFFILVWNMTFCLRCPSCRYPQISAEDQGGLPTMANDNHLSGFVIRVVKVDFLPWLQATPA